MQLPPPPALLVELEMIGEMTTAMLDAAANDRWSEVHRIDSARVKLLRAVPAECFASGDEAVRNLLQDALSATQSIEQQARAMREQDRAELKHLNRRQHAAQAYDSFAALG